MGRASLTASLLGTAFVAAIAATTPAYALEAKQCLPMAEMNAALRAEGQRTMIIGDREVIRNPTNQVKDMRVDRWVNTVTANNDGSLGYQLEGDLPRAQPSTKVCVAAKLTNIRFFDAAKPGVPKGALLGGRIDDVLKANETIGSRPMVVADTLHKGANGSEARGLPMVLSGNVPEKSGVIYGRSANGEPVKLVNLGNLEYTTAGLQRASGTTSLALNTAPRP